MTPATKRKNHAQRHGSCIVPDASAGCARRCSEPTTASVSTASLFSAWRRRSASPFGGHRRGQGGARRRPMSWRRESTSRSTRSRQREGELDLERKELQSDTEARAQGGSPRSTWAAASIRRSRRCREPIDGARAASGARPRRAGITEAMSAHRCTAIASAASLLRCRAPARVAALASAER